MHIPFDDKTFLGGQADQMFKAPRSRLPFNFDAEVVGVFDDMVSRSVPLYREMLPLITHLLNTWLAPKERIYDLGCSTGTSLAFMGHWLTQSQRFIGIDNSAPMIDRAREKLAPYQSKHEIQLQVEDLTAVDFEEAGAFLCLYTLQFVPVRLRLDILQKCHRALRDDGVLIISEKLRAGLPALHEAMTDIYEGFKASRGYSETEIAQKRAALDNVLVPLTAKEWENLLLRAGFSHVECLGRWNNFATFVAVKGPR